MKNGKPVYYPGEASFTTIGGDVDLKISHSGNTSYFHYRVDYKLPEEGTYEVLKTGDVWICKTIDGDYTPGLLYVTEGSGSIYTRSMKTADRIDYNIRFHNLDTDTYYELHTK